MDFQQARTHIPKTMLMFAKKTPGIPGVFILYPFDVVIIFEQPMENHLHAQDKNR
jgi:hypothetical protein